MAYIHTHDYGNSKAPLRIVSLHGFPGLKSKQNRELAENIARELDCRVRVILYPGLSCEGVFSFSETLADLKEQFSEWTQKSKLSLLGHSWGGFLSLALANHLPDRIEKIALMSPLLNFGLVDGVETHFAGTLRNNPGIKTIPLRQLSEDFIAVSQANPPPQLIEKLSETIPLLFLQAREDTITPTAYANEMQRRFKGEIKYELVDNDHSFLASRTELSHTLAAFFR